MNRKYLWLVIAIVCVSIGLALYFGLSNSTESTSATECRKAAEQGDAEAQYDLGVMYFGGRDLPEDDAQAVKWFRKAAEQGLAEAQGMLGFMYAAGLGVQEDDAEAVKWYYKAAEQGDADGQYHLGRVYADDDGAWQDDAQAAKWVRKAARQGHAGAQFDLGVWYAEGRYIEKDEAQAVMWLRKAAEQGSAEAKRCLGDMYDLSIGVPKDGAIMVDIADNWIVGMLVFFALIGFIATIVGICKLWNKLGANENEEPPRATRADNDPSRNGKIAGASIVIAAFLLFWFTLEYFPIVIVAIGAMFAFVFTTLEIIAAVIIVAGLIWAFCAMYRGLSLRANIGIWLICLAIIGFVMICCFCPPPWLVLIGSAICDILEYIWVAFAILVGVGLAIMVMSALFGWVCSLSTSSRKSRNTAAHEDPKPPTQEAYYDPATDRDHN